MTNEAKTLGEFPAYAAEKNREREIKSELNEVGKRLADILTSLSSPTSSIAAEAEAYLSGGESARVNRAALEENLTELRHRQEMLLQAVQLQRRHVDEQRMIASRAICKTLSVEWLKEAKRIGQLSRELAQLGHRQHSFLEDLERQGIAVVDPISRQVTMNDSFLWQLEKLAEESKV